jgi:hypothetical protein
MHRLLPAPARPKRSPGRPLPVSLARPAHTDHHQTRITPMSSSSGSAPRQIATKTVYCSQAIRVAEGSVGSCGRSGFIAGIASESQALLQQVRGYQKPVLLRDSLLDRARIIAIDRVVEYLIEKHRQIRRV